jgi:phospholipid transport system transporter-binding protein
MNEASIATVGGGELKLSGVLDYRTCPALREQGASLIKGLDASALVLDCSAVEKSSSVGLSLLLAFMRDAQAAGKSVSIRALPEDMREIAQVSGVAELFEQH